MAGINQGQPEVAVGEPIRFGDIDGFELEQHPVSDRLIIRDTENGTVAYVKAERGGQIGGDGVLIKALKESKPMADTGRTYATIQEAERQASSWVFVPPGTYNENVEINTQGLTLQGSGYNTVIDGRLESDTNGCSISNIKVENFSSDNVITIFSDTTIRNCWAESGSGQGIALYGSNNKVVNCSVGRRIEADGNNNIISSCFSNTGIQNFQLDGDNNIVCNSIGTEAQQFGVYIRGDNNIAVGNRIINAGSLGIVMSSSAQPENSIVANNRVSDSGGADIENNGSGNILDGNLTGGAN